MNLNSITEIAKAAGEVATALAIIVGAVWKAVNWRQRHRAEREAAQRAAVRSMPRPPQRRTPERQTGGSWVNRWREW